MTVLPHCSRTRPTPTDEDGEEHVRHVHDDHGEPAHESVEASDHRSKQSVVPWTEFVTVRGWSGVDNVFKTFVKDC